MRDPVQVVIAASALVAASAAPSAAWSFREHEAIGDASYRAACKQIRERLDARELAADAPERSRLRIACGDLAESAQLYGQATALAADHVVEPEDFLSASGGWQAVNWWTYVRLALVNSEHFHPLAPRSWSKHHQRATQLARDAYALEGMAQIEAFERARFENAFADHMLQDAFASGHMGFNRPATSAAAAKVFHDVWTRRGRTVRNRKGETWRTFGDGLFETEQNVDGKRHVVATATLSATNLLAAFVEGAPDPQLELEIWESFPFLIEAPELLSKADQLFEDETRQRRQPPMHPLSAINWPARKDRVWDVWLAGYGRLYDRRPYAALLVGRDVSLPLTPSQIYLAAGISLPADLDRPRFAAQAGVTRTLGLSNDGMVSHQINLGALWDARRSQLAGSIFVTYQFTVELASDLFRVQLGPSFDVGALAPGVYFAFGYGKVATAVGGGVRH
jgi:hypothetical protein